MQQKYKLPTAIVITALLIGCAEPNEPATGVLPTLETTPVASVDDAADDPAIWVNPNNAANSLILGTDKKSGLNVYKLDGTVHQFLPAGRLNNVDLRQNVIVGDFSGDLAAASNRTDNSITLFSVTYDNVREIARFPSIETEPYGLCTGVMNGVYTVFVAHKSGNLVAYHVLALDQARVAANHTFKSQLEGCVFDDEQQVLYVGEEEHGIWRINVIAGEFTAPITVDNTGSKTGLKADAEGLALYKTGPDTGFLLASSQGNNSYTVYAREGVNAFVTRFAIIGNNNIDGTEETDGIDATSTPLGSAFPNGLFIAQDGFNKPEGTPQNFKIVDWRSIAALLGNTGDK